MKTVRNITLAIAAGSALALGLAAHAQETKKPEAAAKAEKQHARGEHRGHGMHGMRHDDRQSMREMRERCHGESNEHREKAG